jgi:hypothetical protein
MMIHWEAGAEQAPLDEEVKGCGMYTKFVDLRQDANIVAAKERLIAAAMLHGLETNGNVSRDGVMLYGDEKRINLCLHYYDGRDVPDAPYYLDQSGDKDEDI